MVPGVPGVALADDVAAVVHRIGPAVSAPERAEIDDPALPCPGEAMYGGIPGGEAITGHLAADVHRPGVAGGAAKGAEVDNPTIPRPDEGMWVAMPPGRVAIADDLATVVQV